MFMSVCTRMKETGTADIMQCYVYGYWRLEWQTLCTPMGTGGWKGRHRTVLCLWVLELERQISCSVSSCKVITFRHKTTVGAAAGEAAAAADTPPEPSTVKELKEEGQDAGK